MDLSANKTPIEELGKVCLGALILDTFIVVLLKSDTKNNGRNLISWTILIRIFIFQIIMMLVSISTVLNAEHREDFGEINAGLMK